MKSIAVGKFEASQSTKTETNIARFVWIKNCLAALGMMFRSPTHLDHLNEHLRKDGGICEQELERMKAANAPLIRW